MLLLLALLPALLALFLALSFTTESREFPVVQRLPWLGYVFPLLANYRVGSVATCAAKLVVRYSDWRLSEESRKHVSVLENDRFQVGFWRSNRMYGYFSDGWINKKDESGVWRRIVAWENERPPKKLLWDVLAAEERVRPSEAEESNLAAARLAKQLGL